MARITGINVIAGADLPTPSPGSLTGGSFGPFNKAGALAAGDFNGLAAKGALAIDTTTPKLYQNTGTLAATTWVSVGSQT